MNNNNATIGGHDFAIDGRFKLEVRTDKKKFALTNLNSYVPMGKKSSDDRAQFRTEDGQLVDVMFIDRHQLLFNPAIDWHRENIAILIQHPDVRIGGMSEEDHMELVKKRLKVDNPRFTITNVDKAADDKFEHERNLFKVRAKLYNDDNPISTKLLVFLATKFGVSYDNSITHTEKLNSVLTKALDAFIQSSDDNAKKFDYYFKESKRAESEFYFTHLERLEILENFGGIYKISGVPIGSTVDDIMEYYANNPTLYIEHQKMVRDSLKGLSNIL